MIWMYLKWNDAMKTINRIFAVAFMALCTLAFNACIEEAAPILPEDGTLVEMTFEASVAETKAAFDGKRINWEVGDKVAIYDGIAKREFTVQSVKGGVASIKGPVAAEATEFYAVTPFSAAREALPGDGKIYFNLPTEQVLASGKDFDEDAFVAVGKVDGTRISFKNVVSLLKINIPENITSVSLKGFNAEKIAGAANAGLDPMVAGGTEGSVVLKPAGETFAAGVHYIALLPSTFTNGFKVVYANDNNKISIKKNTGNVVFPINDGFDITAYTTADKLTTWIPNPLMSEDDLLYFVGNQAAYAGEEAKLGQDIELTKQWTPVDLSGTLDGQGYTISGLDVNVTGTTLGAMCSISASASLKNVIIEGQINCSSAKKGTPVGLVGYLHGMMYNVTNRTSVTASNTSDRLYVGGLAGQIEKGRMINCTNEGNVTLESSGGTTTYVGGVAGVIYSSTASGLISGCVNKGKVTSNSEKTNAIGGVLGVNQGGEVVACVNKGTVEVNSILSDGGVGGVAGAVENHAGAVAIIHQCINDEKSVINLNTTNAQAVGGIVGKLDDKTTAVEITECVNAADIAVAVARSFTYTSGYTGYDGFYLGGIVGRIKAENTSSIVNKIYGCTNSGDISATLSSDSGNTNSVKVGGICGNTRGPVILERNETSDGTTISLENPKAYNLLCSVGGIVGEAGDLWDDVESVRLILNGNVNRSTVRSLVNSTEAPAGGLIGYAFAPVTSTGNVNYGTVERLATDDCLPENYGNCFAGGLVGMFRMATASENRYDFIFEGDKTLGTVKSVGRAAMVFGGMRSDSYASKIIISNCTIGGRLESPHSEYALDITENNWNEKNGLVDGSYLWSYVKKGNFTGLEVNGCQYGDVASNGGAEQLTAWQHGYMDIHHISTGRGNCTFMILPDGTTMMVDAGDNGPANDDGTKLDRVPNESLTPAEWIVRYVTHFTEEAGLPAKLDHMLVSHFHYDHVGVGTAEYPWSPDGEYLMTGVSYVGSTLEVDNFVDRAYPDYNFPYTGYFDKGVFRDYVMMDNYLKFLNSDYNRLNNISGFEVGASDQFALKTPRNDFSIRNVYANGQLWTGSGVSSASIVPSELTQSDLQGAENQWSAVVNISYGDFDYHTGGDINGTQLFDVEAEVAKRVGETDVFHCNHHAFDDSMHADVLLATHPQVFVVPAWETGHPGEEALSRMINYGDIFAAASAAKDGMKANGHVVVRVYEGGSEFQIFVLNDRSTDYEVIHKTEKYTSK